MTNYLPDCCCDDESVICPIHGSLSRGRTLRNAHRAVERGVISASAHAAWKKKYEPAKPKVPFGRIG